MTQSTFCLTYSLPIILHCVEWRVAFSILQPWYDEVKDYNFSYGGFAMNTGILSYFVLGKRNTNFTLTLNTGHFTQLVWRSTTQVC